MAHLVKCDAVIQDQNDQIERQDAVRCLSAAICRISNRHSSELHRTQNWTEADELLDRVASRSSKKSGGRRSRSRCGSQCARDACRRVGPSVDVDDGVKETSKTSSSYSSPASQPTNQSKSTPLSLSSKESSSSNKNRLADFWEKSVQAANQVCLPNSFPNETLLAKVEPP